VRYDACGIGALIVGLSIALISPRVADAGLVTTSFSGTVNTIDDPGGYISGTHIGDVFSGTVVLLLPAMSSATRPARSCPRPPSRQAST
jgi:hypothetical protein